MWLQIPLYNKDMILFQVIPVDIHDYHKKEKPAEEMTPEELRTQYKEMGIQPTRPWRERYFYISSSSSVFEPYVAPEGDGKISAINSAVSYLAHIPCWLFFFFFLVQLVCLLPAAIMHKRIELGTRNLF